MTDLIRLLIDAGACRAETDRSHAVCTVSSGIVSLGIPGLPDSNSNVTSLRRMLYSGNPDIVSMAELLIGGRHSQEVLNCFLTWRDSQRLHEQLHLERPEGVVRDEVSMVSAIKETTLPTGVAGDVFAQRHTRGYWAIDSVSLMLGNCAAEHRLSTATPTGRGFTSSRPVPSLLHRTYLQQMLLSSPSADVLGCLLQAGADPSAVDAKGWTPDEAAASNHEVLHRFANGVQFHIFSGCWQLWMAVLNMHFLHAANFPSLCATRIRLSRVRCLTHEDTPNVR